MISYSDGTVELFDVAADPGETRDVAPTRPGQVERMRELLPDL